MSNRTHAKVIKLKQLFNDLTIVEWGKLPKFDMIINATSIGLNKDDEFKIDFKNRDR